MRVKLANYSWKVRIQVYIFVFINITLVETSSEEVRAPRLISHMIGGAQAPDGAIASR